jgi:hypothetical protein
VDLSECPTAPSPVLDGRSGRARNGAPVAHTGYMHHASIGPRAAKHGLERLAADQIHHNRRSCRSC